jgi:hypothetical protein
MDTGESSHSEHDLALREDRVRSLNIQPLHADQAARFSEAWLRVQARFVENPAESIVEADRLVTEAMQAKGYPLADFEQRAADISVEHPRVVENYRAATAISLRSQRGNASTEELRQAMVHYRTLFEDLLDTQD